MYNPERFKVEDKAEAFELMDRYPLATLISVPEGRPFVSHLPLVPKKNGDQVELVGHLARANPHWKLLPQGPVTVIFHGPHAYITPQWYEAFDVPTWSYLKVQCRGRVEMVETEDGVLACLRELSAHTEKHWPSDWEFGVPEDLSGPNLLKGIVGFRILVDEISYKKKMVQPRAPADRAGAMRGLATRQDEGSRGILSEMLKLFRPDGEPR